MKKVILKEACFLSPVPVGTIGEIIPESEWKNNGIYDFLYAELKEDALCPVLVNFPGYTPQIILPEYLCDVVAAQPKRVFRTALWAKDKIDRGCAFMVEAEAQSKGSWQKDCEGQEVVNGACWLPECIFAYDIEYQWTEEVKE